MFGLCRNRHGRCRSRAPVLRDSVRHVFKVCSSTPSGKRSAKQECAYSIPRTGDTGNVLHPMSENEEMAYLRRRAEEIKQSEKVKSTLENPENK